MIGKKRYPGEEAVDKLLQIMYDELSGKVSEDQLNAVKTTLTDMQQVRADTDYNILCMNALSIEMAESIGIGHTISYPNGISERFNSTNKISTIVNYIKSNLWSNDQLSTILDLGLISTTEHSTILAQIS